MKVVYFLYVLFCFIFYLRSIDNYIDIFNGCASTIWLKAVRFKALQAFVYHCLHVKASGVTFGECNVN